MLEIFQQHNITTFLVRFEKNYLGGDIFLPDYVMKEWQWVEYNGGEIYSHLTLGTKIPKEVKNIFPSLYKYMRDKYITEQLFPQYCIKSIICHNYWEIQENFQRIKTKFKVLKPYNESQGKGIIISQNIPHKTQLKERFYPYLLQEFFDTSKWFWGYRWYHDFRIIMLDGEIIAKILRQPKSWKLIANVAQDGVLRDMEQEEIPEEIEKIIFEVEAYFAKKQEHRYYSVDFWVNEKGTIKIFEMNSYPWLWTSKTAKCVWEYIINNILKIW